MAPPVQIATALAQLETATRQLTDVRSGAAVILEALDSVLDKPYGRHLGTQLGTSVSADVVKAAEKVKNAIATFRATGQIIKQF